MEPAHFVSGMAAKLMVIGAHPMDQTMKHLQMLSIRKKIDSNKNKALQNRGT